MSAAVERDPFDNRWFSKRKAVNRIDPLVALTMGVGQASQGRPRLGLRGARVIVI
jgi:phage terminase large subunit-like protein